MGGVSPFSALYPGVHKLLVIEFDFLETSCSFMEMLL
jgi:hypothetical protein